MTNNPPRLVVLTPRQRDVIGEITRDGAGNVEIGERLGIGAGTVRNHLHAVHQAAGITSRTALVVALLKRQLIVRTVEQRPRTRKDAA